jgi:hypothetical protein
MLYFTPGLLACETARTAYHFAIPHFRPAYSSEMTWETYLSPVRLCKSFVILAISTAILTSLEVIEARLMVQQNHTPQGYRQHTSEERGTAGEVNERVGARKDVIA